MNKLIQSRVRATTQKRTEITVGREALLLMLRDAGFSVPASAAVVVKVPGGADWSNTDLDIDDDTHITVRFESSETTEETDDA
jgi:hypothetical protein